MIPSETISYISLRKLVVPESNERFFGRSW